MALYGPEKPSFIFYYSLIEVEGIGQTDLGTRYLVYIEILNNIRKLCLAVQCSVVQYIVYLCNITSMYISIAG